VRMAHSMCDQQREQDRGETLSLKKKGKHGFAANEGQIPVDSCKTLRLKTNKKLHVGFNSEER